MSLHSRQILTTGSSRKRKERETSYSVKPPPPPPPPPPPLTVVTTTTTSSKAAELDSSNMLLAGCMAYEFLTKGTLLGKECHDSAQAQPGRPVSMISSAERVDGDQSSRKLKVPQQSYGEVARLLNSDGAHIQGIVNPTQLARWIQM